MAKNFTPKIGKTVLETLTSGMYEDARFIYREYIQNAADQIDEAVELGILKEKSEGKIEVTIDVADRKIVISDNATGVSEKEVLHFLGDVANSQKDTTKRKGFRGIGRLGGLGYCDRLIFETSYKGENVKSKMTLNANLLKKIIDDKRDRSDAAAVMSVITIEDPPRPEEAEKHYFRVILENVPHNDILDTNYVKDYLSMVAPVPFSSVFTFADEIKTYFKTKNLVLDEYNIEINKATLFKGYKNSFNNDGIISNLVGVDFVDIMNDEQDLIATCWYGYREHSNIVLDESNKERGLRLRTKNISIGNEFTCSRFFNQERTNLRFIGEIHTLSSGFIPNARRDYFTENNTCRQFEKNTKDIFDLENLENRLAQTASKLHNRLQEIKNYNKAYKDFKSKKGEFENEATETYRLNRLKELEEKAVKAKREIEKINNKANSSNTTRKLYDNIIGENDISVKALTPKELQISKYTPPNFARLNKEQKKVVLEIFEILEDELDFDLSEIIKKKIIDRFN